MESDHLRIITHVDHSSRVILLSFIDQNPLLFHVNRFFYYI
jgi:hypothetical protein